MILTHMLPSPGDWIFEPRGRRGERSIEHLRCGIIGIKGMGRGHAHALAGIERARLAAVADLDLAAAERVAAEHGAQAFAVYRQMLERVELDAVIVATPHFLHAPMALDCLAAGRHVFVEKP